jgi:hypothetical protein
MKILRLEDGFFGLRLVSLFCASFVLIRAGQCLFVVLIDH